MSLSNAAKLLPGADLVVWLEPLGRAVRYFAMTMLALLRPRYEWRELRTICVWMGPQSFHLVALAACAVSIALTLQCIIELDKYQAQDLAGAVISLGLLRELGPLTVSLAWCARVAALVADQAETFSRQNPQATDWQFASSFIAPRYTAALTMSIPLGAYGLIIGFVTGALLTPLLTLSTTRQFIISSSEIIHSRDVIVYFVKLILVNPTIAIFAACAAGRLADRDRRGGGEGFAISAAARGVTAMFITAFFANLFVTLIAYLK